MDSNRLTCRMSSSVCLGAVLLACQAATAQYGTGFEAVNASPAGTVLTGQDAYYLPAGTDSVDFYAYTYTGNVLSIVQNPCGGSQFVAGTGPGNGTTYARAQRDITWGTGVWVATYDAAAQYVATPPTQNNIGSFSLQPYPGSASYIHLFSWVDINIADAWQAYYLAYDANGTAHAQPGQSPGSEWTNLPLNHWYRFRTTIDFDLNRITEVTITDLETGDTATFNPADWYLEGGQAGGMPIPTGFRFFGGGGTPSANTAAFDNLIIGTPCPADLNGDRTVNTVDLLLLLAAWGTPCGDVDGDGDTDTSDLLALLAAWGACP